MAKGILTDKNTGNPIHVGNYIFGTARFEDGSTAKFNGVQLIEIVQGLYGVIYQGNTYTVAPREGCGQIIKAFIHRNKIK